MSLQVDLIMETERRSGSRITLSSLIRIAAVTAPMLVILFLFMALAKYQTLRTELRRAEIRWQRLEQEYEDTLAMKETVRESRAVLAEIGGWKNARVQWCGQLAALQEIVPEQVQLTELSVDDIVQVVSNKTVRAFKMRLDGKTGGTNAEYYVAGLKDELSRDAAIEPFISGVQIPAGSFGPDRSAGASRFDRVFTIVCEYYPKAFE